MLTEAQKDYLTELINIGVGQGAASLSEMVGAKVRLKVPDIDVCQLNAMYKCLEKLNADKVSAVQQGFSGSLSGDAYLVFSHESAKNLAAKLLEEELDAESADVQTEEVITEVGNIIINSFLGLWSHIFPNHLNYEVPSYHLKSPDELFADKLNCTSEERKHIVVSANAFFIVKDLEIVGTVLVVFELSSIEQLVGVVDKTVHNSCST
ncbi:MAG: hypothetical protein KAR42_17525 [candidate division Zixibacteria bacterium]|nr:hypothetical protein [candidate division Zixibacteria bacterium]